MPIPVIETWTKNSKVTSTEATLDLTKPTGVSAGDLLLIIIANDASINGDQWVNGGPDAHLSESGWSFISEAGNSVPDAHIAVFYKIATGSDASTITVTSSYSAYDMVGFFVRISGVDTTAPINAYDATDRQADNVSTLTINGITTSANNCLAMFCLAFDGGDGLPFSTSSSGWSITDEMQADTTGGTSSACFGSKSVATAGSTGDVVVNASATDGMTGFQFAILGTAGSATNIDVNQSTELDSSQLAGKKKLKEFIQALETNLSQIVGKEKSKSVAQSTETDSSQAVGKLKSRIIYQSFDIELAQSISVIKNINIGQCFEIDSVNAIDPVIVVQIIVDEAQEADAAQAIDKIKLKTVSQSLETDLSQSLDKSKLKILLQSSEDDTAQAIDKIKQGAIEQAIETETTQSFATSKLTTLSEASESGSAQTLSVVKYVDINLCTEIDSVNSISPSVVAQIDIIQAIESDESFTFAKVKIKSTEQCLSSEQDLSINVIKKISLIQAVEIGDIFAFASKKVKALTQAPEIDSSQSLNFISIKNIPLVQSIETDSVQSITRQKKISLDFVSTIEYVFGITAKKVSVIGLISETDFVYNVGKLKSKIFSQTLENDLSIQLVLALPALASVDEIDLAQVLNKEKLKEFNFTAEVESSLPVIPIKYKTFGQVTEADILLLINAAKRIGIEPVFEANLGHQIERILKRYNISLATEEDSGSSILPFLSLLNITESDLIRLRISENVFGVNVFELLTNIKVKPIITDSAIIEDQLQVNIKEEKYYDQ